MAKEKPQAIISAPIWGVFLLFAGIVLLLQTLNVLPWDLWKTLWRFWPVLIIIVGLGILLRRYNPWLVSLLILTIFGACLGIAIWQNGLISSGGIVTAKHTEPLGNINYAQIKVNFTAGSITIGSLPSTSPNLAEIDSEVQNGQKTIEVSFQHQDSEGELNLNSTNQQFWEEGGINWEASFTRKIPLAINIKSSASNMNLNLSKLKLTDIRLEIDTGNCIMAMPSTAGTTNAYIKSDVANLEVTIPDEVAARIKVDTDLSASDIDENRFPKEGDYYISQNFDSAENRIELEIDSAVGRVQVR